jgi:Ubiquitin interaction motif
MLDAAGPEQEDEQLQQALALSLADASAAACPPDTGDCLGTAPM